MIVLSLGVALLAAACADDGGENGDGDTDTSSPETATEVGGAPTDVTTPSAGGSGGDAPSGDSVADVTLTLTGGPDEGEYEASTPDGGCSYGLTGEGGFGLQFSLDVEEGFSSLQLVVPNTEDAADGTSEFMTTATIGPLLSGNNYEINALPDAGEPSGSGTVTIDDREDTATIQIEGETADGVGIDAQVECHSVLRM